MKRLSNFLTRLYPEAWRRRYEAEFRTLLEDVDVNWRTPLDIAKGVVAMHLWTLGSQKILAISALVGLFIGLGLWRMIPNQYVSTSLIKIEAPGSAGMSNASKMSIDRIKRAFGDKFLVELIERYKLYPADKGKMPLAEIIAGMKRNIQVRPSGQDSVALGFNYSDPLLAHNVAKNLVERLMAYNVDAAIAGERALTLEVLDSPSLSEDPISPSPFRLIILGLCAGIIAGSVIVILRRSPRFA